MRYFFLIISSVLLINCGQNYGYIYDEDTNKPLKDVIVIDINNKNNFLKTRSDGKFSFKNCENLIVKKDTYKIDTLEKYGCKPNGKCFNGKIFYLKKDK